MRIKALGAVGTVTGSCFQIEKDNGDIVLLDCGLFQGGRQTELRNTHLNNYNIKQLKAIVITHAHMDHSGLVPRLIKEGYRGPIYATQPTCELLGVLWQDAANIQAHEALWKSRKNRRQWQKDVEPLYTAEDATQATTMLQPLRFDEPTEIIPGVVVHYIVAGHILGAGSVHFTITEGRSKKRIVFSGDLGRPGQILMPDPVIPPLADVVFMETTYGDRNHKKMDASQDELFEVINQAYREGGKILIPAFAVERTQELLLLIAKAFHEKKIPAGLNIYLDSPLAIATTEIYGQHQGLFDQDTKDWAKAGISLNNVPNLSVVREARDSQKLNELTEPAIIIAGSGMANAGRILHHLKHNLWQKNTHVIFVGFQAQGTTGRLLVDGAKTVKIFREVVTVGAQIHTIGGFSSHAGQDELLQWIAPQVERRPGLQVNLIHGEPSITQKFCALAEKELSGARFSVPEWMRYTELGEDAAPQSSAVESQINVPAIEEMEESVNVSQSLATRFERLLNMSKMVNKLSPAELAALEANLAQVENALLAGEAA